MSELRLVAAPAVAAAYPAAAVQRLYDMMPKFQFEMVKKEKMVDGKKILEEVRKVEAITDDLVAYYNLDDRTYYVGLHAKEFEGEKAFGLDGLTQETAIHKKKGSVFLCQMHAFQSWLNTIGNTRCVLMMDANTVIGLTDGNTFTGLTDGNTFTYKPKDPKKAESGSFDHPFTQPIISSKVDYYTTDKMRLFTAQLDKMFFHAYSIIDYVFIFNPNEDDKSKQTKQIAVLPDGKIGVKTNNFLKSAEDPADHTAVMIADVGAVYNSSDSGPAFNGGSVDNVYEFMPQTVADQLLSQRQIIDHIINPLRETIDPTTGKEKEYNKPRCKAFDIHLHPDYMPVISINQDGTFTYTFSSGKTFEAVIAEAASAEAAEAASEALQFKKWLEEFEKCKTDQQVISEDAINNKFIPLFNAWHEISNHPDLKHIFVAWYNSSRQAISKTDVVKKLFEQGAKNVAVLEVNKSNLEIIKRDFPTSEYVIHTGMTEAPESFKLSTFGCIISQKAGAAADVAAADVAAAVGGYTRRKIRRNKKTRRNKKSKTRKYKNRRAKYSRK